jgi:hypothetical protein
MRHPLTSLSPLARDNQYRDHHRRDTRFSSRLSRTSLPDCRAISPASPQPAMQPVCAFIRSLEGEVHARLRQKQPYRGIDQGPRQAVGRPLSHARRRHQPPEVGYGDQDPPWTAPELSARARQRAPTEPRLEPDEVRGIRHSVLKCRSDQRIRFPESDGRRSALSTCARSSSWPARRQGGASTSGRRRGWG